VNKLNNANVNYYLKIPRQHCGPHKMPLWATCGLMFQTPGLGLFETPGLGLEFRF